MRFPIYTALSVLDEFMVPDTPTSASALFYLLRALHFDTACTLRAARRMTVVVKRSGSPDALVKRPLCILYYVITDYNTISRFLLRCYRAACFRCAVVFLQSRI